MLIAIGSTNPCKTTAIENIFKKVWPKAKFKSLKVSSGVSPQPLSEAKTIKGAINRAKEALRKTNAKFGVGIEGGVRKVKNSLFTTAWCAVVDQNGKISLGGGLIMPLPQKISQKIIDGEELGEVMDKLTGIKEVKKKMGAVGVLTKGLVNRTKAYEIIVSYALTKFLNPKIYQNL